MSGLGLRVSVWELAVRNQDHVVDSPALKNVLRSQAFLTCTYVSTPRLEVNP